ncbi:hypothetical protein ACSLBF_21185 (plasmid) [Pseudoalteromonas sp. T1lg65]|uniref:hypothetical protein n=1 Tax=Pseudoalteromonas sp. T1lg65 TaxID=2077101 RepID=UPI003F7A4D55
MTLSKKSKRCFGVVFLLIILSMFGYTQTGHYQSQELLGFVNILLISAVLLIKAVEWLTGYRITPEDRYTQSHPKVQNPVEQVVFSDTYMSVNDAKFPLSKVRKIALEVVGKEAYFSMPYNQISVGVIPSFRFDAKQLEAFKAHLTSHISHVSFIK